jgi:TRAP-type C4-dicarboxylate transport system substrate-binding protein
MKVVILLIICLFSTSSFAVKIKLATIVPKGTSWANTLKAFSKEVKQKTKKKVKIQIYYGGVQGDEPDVLRKTRIGQLHGAIFTGKTLGDIFPDIRSIEIPFNYYHDESKAVAAIKSQRKYFDENLEKKGFVNLGFYSIGKVYVVSTKEVKSITDLQGIKMWAWEGDKVVHAMIKSLGLVSVPLALPDVLSSLSTGMIEAAYAPPLGILALQWQSKVKYLVDFPTAYTIGALLISNKRWKRISPENQKLVKEIAKKHIDKANELAIEDNKKALAQLKELGVKFVSFPKEDLAKAEKIRKNVIKLLEGPVLSSQTIQSVESGR